MTQITIEQARAKHGLTQEEVAKKLGVSRQTYQNYENYKTIMQISTGYMFSKIVDVDFDDIVFFKNTTTLEV